VDHGFEVYEPVGCVRCAFHGFKGRVGLYELMPVTDGLRGKILAGDSVGVLRECAHQDGMRTLREDGVEKIRRGLTSVSEVLRVLGPAGR
jgi:type II secretory ATPase GspE/PulE/Tfp pilus assembly ATPase PilB-like protein